MFWIKLGILLTGFTYAGLLPFYLSKFLKHIDFDLKSQTLSFLSNKHLYGKKYKRGYRRLLFLTAFLNYVFFALLAEFYELGEYESIIRYIDYTFALLILLGFIPHNMSPFGFRFLSENIQRILHNVLAGLVFISLPILIVNFQLALYYDLLFQGLIGLIIIGITILSTAWFIMKQGVNGFAEIIFINGISIWSIFTTIITILR